MKKFNCLSKITVLICALLSLSLFSNCSGSEEEEVEVLPKVIEVANVSIPEGNDGTSNVMTFIVKLAKPASLDVTFDYATMDIGTGEGNAMEGASDPGDYIEASGSGTIVEGETKTTIEVTINGDKRVEPDETFNLVLTAVTGITLLEDNEEAITLTAIGTIEDDGDMYPGISIADKSISEGNSGTTSTITFTVTLSEAYSYEDVTFDYTTSGGDATVGTSDPGDYAEVSGSGTIIAGATEATIEVTINGDKRVEPDETFNLVLTAVTGITLLEDNEEAITLTAIGTIEDDGDMYPGISIADKSISEGNSGTTSTITFTVTLSEAYSYEDVTFDYTTSGGDATVGTSDSGDYIEASGSGTIVAGGTQTTINVTINGDKRVEPDETFNLVLTNIQNASLGTLTALGTIQNDGDVYPTISIADSSVTEGDSGTDTITFTVTLSEAYSYEDVTFNYATNSDSGATATVSTDYMITSGSGTIVAGNQTTTLSVLINGDTDIESDETFNLVLSSLTNALAADITALGTITNNDFKDVDEDNDNLIEIRTAEEFNNMREDLTGSSYMGSSHGCLSTCNGYELENNIDLTGITWVPIGSDGTPFSAIFKGNDKTISNLEIVGSSGTAYVGLFSEISSTISNVTIDGSTVSTNYTSEVHVGALTGKVHSSATVSNVVSMNANITGKNSNSRNRIGGLVGLNEGTIKDSVAMGGTVKVGSSSGSGYAGGLVGVNDGGTISDSYSTTGAVIGGTGSSSVGGLAGRNINDAIIEDSYSTNTATAKDNIYDYVGGLVGRNDSSAIVRDSYASGDVDGGGDEDNVGGLVGRNNSSAIIQNSYASGNVDGGGGNDYVGGLAGWNYGSAIIQNSYASGDVDGGGGDDYIGGLVGRNDGSTIRNSYASGAVDGGNSNNDADATDITTYKFDYVGGLVGGNINSAMILNSYSTANVTGGAGNDVVGGLAGWNLLGGRIENVYATGSVSGGGDYDYVSRIVGNNFDSPMNSQDGILESHYYNRGSSHTTGEDEYKYGLGASETQLKFAQNPNQTVTLNINTEENCVRAGGDLLLAVCTLTIFTRVESTCGLAALGTSWSGSLCTKQLDNTLYPSTVVLIYGDWDTKDWDFGSSTQFPALRSYKENTAGVQETGEILCGQGNERASGPSTCP